MRLVTYNIEWFSHLFDGDDQLMLDGRPSRRRGVDRYTQGRAIAHVLDRLDADAVMVIEAPNSGHRQKCTRALENFAAQAGLRCNKAVSGFATHTEQEIALMFDPDQLQVQVDPQSSSQAPCFDTTFHIDLDVDDREDPVRFSKPPLELQVTTKGGTTLRMIGVHLKSKAPYNAKTPEEVVRISIANRRKQLAQAVWLSRRVQQHRRAAEPVIVMGDLNDGPGLDEYERLFGKSSVEIVMGADLTDPNAQSLVQPRAWGQPATARFYHAESKRYFGALLDYIMISPELAARAPRWRIWHPFEDGACYADSDLRTALLAASDHFPVSLDLELT